jgi:alkylation response protein AidB-like acyl-CoA dehydrogenase
MKTRAERRGDRFVVNGEKMWITSGGFAKVIILFARTGEGPGTRGLSTLVITPDLPGFSVGREEDKMGIRSSNTVSLSFDDCEVPAENLLGEPGGGFKVAMTALDGGRLGIGSQATGIAQGALDAAARYASERVQFGRPIADFQSISNKLADMATEIDASRLLLLRACWLKENGRRFTREASMAKLYASEMANRVCGDALQIHGGYGYVKEFDVERFYREARVTTIYEGTSEVQRIVIAREHLANSERTGA